MSNEAAAAHEQPHDDLVRPYGPWLPRSDVPLLRAHLAGRIDV